MSDHPEVQKDGEHNRIHLATWTISAYGWWDDYPGTDDEFDAKLSPVAEEVSNEIELGIIAIAENIKQKFPLVRAVSRTGM